MGHFTLYPFLAVCFGFCLGFYRVILIEKYVIRISSDVNIKQLLKKPTKAKTEVFVHPL